MKFGESCTFRCQEGASLYGNDTSITCQENGLWSQPKSQCYAKCKLPFYIPNSKPYDSDWIENKCVSTIGTVAMGTRCR